VRAQDALASATCAALGLALTECSVRSVEELESRLSMRRSARRTLSLPADAGSALRRVAVTVQVLLRSVSDSARAEFTAQALTSDPQPALNMDALRGEGVMRVVSGYMEYFKAGNSPGPSDHGSGLSGGQVAGVVVGCVVGTALIVGVAIAAALLMRRRQQHSGKTSVVEKANAARDEGEQMEHEEEDDLRSARTNAEPLQMWHLGLGGLSQLEADALLSPRRQLTSLNPFRFRALTSPALGADQPGMRTASQVGNGSPLPASGTGDAADDADDGASRSKPGGTRQRRSSAPAGPHGETESAAELRVKVRQLEAVLTAMLVQPVGSHVQPLMRRQKQQLEHWQQLLQQQLTESQQARQLMPASSTELPPPQSQLAPTLLQQLQQQQLGAGTHSQEQHRHQFLQTAAEIYVEENGPLEAAAGRGGQAAQHANAPFVANPGAQLHQGAAKLTAGQHATESKDSAIGDAGGAADPEAAANPALVGLETVAIREGARHRCTEDATVRQPSGSDAVNFNGCSDANEMMLPTPPGATMSRAVDGSSEVVSATPPHGKDVTS